MQARCWTYLLSEGLLSGLSRAKLRLTVLVYTVDADGGWGILVALGVTLNLLNTLATVALVIRMRHLFNLFESCILTRSMQWTLIAPFLLLVPWVRAGSADIDVR